MVDEITNESETCGFSAPERGHSVGKPAAVNGGQNQHHDFRRASTSSETDGGNLRGHSLGKSNNLPSHFRASTGSLHDVANSRGKSTRNPSPRNSWDSVSPRYLRASTGSCHDFCKHGWRCALQVKSRSSSPKRMIPTPSDRQNPAGESGVPAERKLTKVVKPKPSPLAKTLPSNSPNRVSSIQASSNENKKAPIEKKENFLGKIKPYVKPKTMKPKPLYASGGLKGGRQSETKVDKTIGSSKALLKKVNEAPAASLSCKPSLSRTARSSVENCRSPKNLSPPQDQKRIRKSEPKQPNQRTLHVMKVRTGNKALESTQRGRTIHSLPSPSFPPPKLLSLLKSPSMSFHEDEAQEELEYTDSPIPSHSLQWLPSPKLPSLPKSPSSSFHEGEAQEEFEYTENTIHSTPHQLLSSHTLSSLPKPPSLSFHDGGAQEELEYTDSAAHSPPPQLLSSSLLSSPKISSLPKSPSLSFHEAEAQEEYEYTENTVHSPPPQSLPLSMISSLSKPPSLSFHEDEDQELEHTDSTIPSPPPQSLSSSIFSSLPKSPSLSSHEDEAEEEYEYTDSEADEYDCSISESSETINLLEVDTSDANCNRVSRKAGIRLSEDKDCVPMKLKFRRGKVVELRPENSGPRRLRFRRGRVLGVNQDTKAEFQRQKYKERDVDDETDGTKGGSGKVVLRHQDVEEKKDAQGLFNNVIEETASKLVESRKSKVQALVGAFETVISIQKSKPSTQTVP